MGIRKKAVLFVLAVLMIFSVSSLSSMEYLDKDALPGIETTRTVVEGFLTPVNPGEHFNLDYVADDVVFMCMALGVPVANNKEEAREIFGWVFNIAFEDASVEDVKITIGNGRAVVEWALVGVHAQDFFDIPPSGEVERVPWTFVFELEKEWPYRIQLSRGYALISVLM